MVKIITFSRCLLVAAVVAGGMACVGPALAGDGYEGVMAAPSDDTSGNAPAQTGAQASPGYNGVVADPSAPAAAEPAEAAAPQYTVPPNRTAPMDLRTAAIINGAPPIKAPSVDFSATQHDQIAGRPAAEYMANQQIKQAMSSVNDSSLSSAERAMNARNAYQNLSTLANGLRSKQAIPDNTYKSLGLTDTYINDERNGNAAALTQLDSALSTLQTSQ